jgi:hypothetical protein
LQINRTRDRKMYYKFIKVIQIRNDGGPNSNSYRFNGKEDMD